MNFVNRHSRKVPWILFVVTLLLMASPCWSADPYLVRDINPGSSDSYISNVATNNGLLYFRAYSPSHGHEPWRSDGTEAGTFMIQELGPGTGSSLPAFFSELGFAEFFTASISTGPGIFRTMGLSNDVAIVKESFVLWASTSPMASAGGLMFLSGSEVGPLGGDKELWRSNGTPAGTVRVKDINPGSLASYPENLVAVGNTLYFSAYDATHGTRLWRSDGTAPGTFLVQDTHNGLYPSSPIELTQAGDRLFLGAVDETHGAELWMVDRGVLTVIDIRPKDIGSGTGGVATVGNGVCFRSLGDGTTTTGAELWCSDGTAAWKVKEIAPGTTPAYIALITDFDGTVFYFIADDTINGSELWRSDGTSDGTWMIKNINPSGDSMNNVNSEIVSFCGGIFFTADDGVNGFELWRSDGTSAGTTMVADLNPSGDAYPSNLTVVGNVLFFTAHEPTNGMELWGLDLSSEPCVVCPDPCLFRDSFEWGFTPWSGWRPRL
jgi:ELWxxDGT repeat protein